MRRLSSYRLIVSLDPSPEQRVLDAAKLCCERWGMDRITVDDIAAEARISRATLYRLFPGGKDVLFEALRARETRTFFDDLDAHVAAADDLEELIVSILVEATAGLRADEHLQVMLASQPGEVLHHMNVEDLPSIIDVATAFLTPRVAPFIGVDQSAELAEWLTRVVLSFFFSPSHRYDLADPSAARVFTRRYVLPAFTADHIHPVTTTR
jgi:AcrR family transcriptional regulator